MDMKLAELKKKIDDMDLGEMGPEVKGLLQTVIDRAHGIGYAEGIKTANRIQAEVNEMMSKKLSEIPE